MTQTDIIIDRVRKNGLAFVDDIVKIIKKTGATFDEGLCHARVLTINESKRLRAKAGGVLLIHKVTTATKTRKVIAYRKDILTAAVPPFTRKRRKGL